MKQRSESISQSRTKQRKALLSWAWSFCTHLAFVLALNFVVMNDAADRFSFEIMAINEATAEQELTLIPEFELISPNELETVEQELLPEIVELAASLQPMQLAKPTEPSEPEPVESVGEKPAVSSEAATVAMPRARAIAVANIQGRVVKAGGKRGEVQFALAWKNFNDVARDCTLGGAYLTSTPAQPMPRNVGR
jgi:hypothetical protein